MLQDPNKLKLDRFGADTFKEIIKPDPHNGADGQVEHFCHFRTVNCFDFTAFSFCNFNIKLFACRFWVLGVYFKTNFLNIFQVI